MSDYPDHVIQPFDLGRNAVKVGMYFHAGPGDSVKTVPATLSTRSCLEFIFEFHIHGVCFLKLFQIFSVIPMV